MRIPFRSLLLAAVVLPASGTLHAANVTWAGTTSSAWSDTTNWTGGALPGIGDTVLLSTAPTTLTVDLGGVSQTVGAVYFNGSGTGAFTIQDGMLILTSNSNTIQAASSLANNEIINAAVQFGTSDNTYVVNWNNASKSLTIGGNITAGGSGANTISLTSASGGSVNLNGAISNGNASSLGLKTSVTTLTLGGTVANTFTGDLQIVGGTVKLNKTAGVNAVAGDIAISGGTLTWGAANQIADTSTITISSTGAIASAMTETLASVSTSGNQGKFNPGSGTNLTITGALSISDDVGVGNANYYSLAANSAASTLTVGSLNMSNAVFQVGQGGNYNATLVLNGDFTGANGSGTGPH